MRKRYSTPKRLLALLLCAVMVFSVMPQLSVSAGDSAAGITGTVADPHTLDSWKLAFDPVNITTQHAGGVWTDKSVLTSSDLSALGNVPGLSIGENNFLVALSALAANSAIAGQGSTPTDTVFVLDISGSLSGTELNAMVSAANSAIHSLLNGNADNRVGIVLYSTNAHILLPLDHYTPVTDGDTIEYIERTNGAIRTGRVQTNTTGGNGGGPGGNNNRPTYDYILNSDQEEVNQSVSTGGGTYIQGGLWGALSLFSDEDNIISDVRTPVVVLMSDGAPTYTTNNYSDVPAESNYGAGNSSTAGDGFVTGLTASYVKNQIANKYGTDAYLYTLGLGVDNVTDSDVAKAVLDPIDSKHTDIEGLWDVFYALASAQDQSMEVDLGDSYWSDPTVSYTDGLEEVYVDKYFSASEASDLATQFQKIVNEISLQNGYYVTHLDGETANLGGYITFVDEIGTGMQVKAVKGILVGETLYSGVRLVEALLNQEFGTATEPTILGDNMVWALKQRLGITETSVIHALIQDAYDAGQIGMTTDGQGNVTSFSNYIGWFSNSDGDFVGFWDAEDPDATVPAGAAYANKCYSMLGTTTDDQTNHASDMMYVTIQVSKKITDGKILDKTPEQVTFRIPAALLPMVTYQIELDGESVDSSTKATVTYKGADPVRLLYEVGVHEKLTSINIHEFLREGYQAKDDDGNYYLYTNAWNWEGADSQNWKDVSTHPTKGSEVLWDTSKNAITYAYFEPGLDNEHYYFTSNEDIYIKNGDTYTKVTDVSQLVAGNTYYYKHTTFTTTENGEKDKGVIHHHYDELSAEALQVAIDGNTTFVPKGTMHFYNHTHDRDKDSNATGSFFAIRHHLVDAKISGSDSEELAYELIYMGNNGRVTYAPAQGIAISKEMADGTTPDATFTFDVELSDGKTADYETLHVAVNGAETSGTVKATAGKLTVQLKPGEKIYILGIDDNVTYEVTERRSDGYLQSDVTGTPDTVVPNKVGEVKFINRVRGVGSLSIFKTVEYKNGASKTDAAASKTFPVTVTVKDGDVLFNGKVYVDGVETTVTDGVIRFNLTDGQTVSITNLPEAYTYAVVEGANLPAGYTYGGGVNLTGPITTGNTSAALNNIYTPESVTVQSVDPEIVLNIYKVLNGGDGNEVVSWPSDANFTFELKRFVDGAWADQNLSIDAITTKGQSVSFNLAGQKFDAVGEYLFRVSEVKGDRLGMAYDTTDHDFRVYVTDSNLDGALEISKVEVINALETEMEQNGTNGKWVIGATFTNVFVMNSANWTPSTAVKTLNGRELKDGEFSFTLYSVDAAGNRTKVATVGNGKLGDIHFPAQVFTAAGDYTFIVAENGGNLGGVTYDQSEYKVVVSVRESATGNVGQLVVTNVARTQIKDAAGNTVNSAVEKVTFTNTYEAKPVTAIISGNKTLTNLTPGVANADMTASIQSQDYTFILTMEGGQYKQVNSGVAAGYDLVDEGQISVNAGGSFSRSGLYFDAAGTYVFTLKEQDFSATKHPGVTKDSSVYKITIVVTDNGAGKLEVTSVTYTKDGIPVSGIAFNNTYKAEAAEPVKLEGTKELTGIRNIIDGEFSFVLKDSTGAVVETVKNTGKEFAFSQLVFDAVGTYKYTISEVYAGKTVHGVTYDSKVYDVTVTVTDPGTGKLEATTAITVAGTSATEIAFTNAYNAAPVKVALTGRKNLVGRPSQYPLQDQEFSFHLNGEGYHITVSNDAEGNVLFPELEYTEPGTYKYTITEVIPSQKAPGILYDETVHEVTVTVTDNGKGQLVAKVEVTNEDATDIHFRFFNRYHAEDTDPVVLEGNKTLTGRPLGIQNNEFTFVLKDSNGNVVESVKNTGNTFKFKGLTFDAVGTYTYTVEEENGGSVIAGIAYDRKVYTVTVTVTDEGTGKLKAEVAYSLNGNTANGLVFSNIYDSDDSAPVQLSGIKVLTGRPNEYPMKDGEFSFTLEGPNVAGGSQTVQNVGNAFTFDPLTFTQTGDYTYTITEVKAGETINGVTYDKTIYEVIVRVTDNNEGQLVTEIIYDNNTNVNNVVFTNTYKADKTDEVILSAGKELTGRPEGLKDNEFSFTLTGPNVVGNSETVKNVGGRVTFTALTFDTVGTYEYTITEVDGGLSYIDYDDTVFKAIVEVKDLGTGKLTATVTYTKNGTVVNAAEVIFKNSYKAGDTDEVVLGGDKTLTDITGGANTTMTPGNDYRFNLKGDNVNETVTNNGGKFTFSALKFTAAGTYTYTITEVETGKSGIIYDEREYKVTIVVEDDSTGKLKVKSVTYTLEGQTADKIVFENKYNAKPVTDVVIEAGKELTDITGGGSLKLEPQNGDFSFNLKGENVDETVKNVGGKVTFPALSFSKPGVYKYTLTEVKGDKTGIGYDENTVYDVTVTVTDPGDGQLVASVKYEKNNQNVDHADVVFKNTFTGEDAELTLAGKKTLTGGRPLKANEFSFVLKDSTGKEIQTVKNAADGSFRFDKLTFDTVGTYEYTISEVKGTDDQIKYDETVYEITVTVTYDGQKMTAVATVDGKTVNEYGYTNVFTPNRLSVNISAEKKLTNYTNKTMGLDGFTFQITDGSKVYTAVSGADGLAVFEIEYTAEDIGKTYNYKLTEVKGNVEDMTYDETVYDVTVAVTQDAVTGELKATVTQTAKAVFTNVYGTYEEPPVTADAFQVHQLTTMLVISAFSLLAVMVIGKKKLLEQ